MIHTAFILVLLATIEESSAFPSVLAKQQAGSSNALLKRAGGDAIALCPHLKRQSDIAKPPFDPELQYVSNTGQHAFQPPAGNDQRGPCPGLNAMANHGYIPHNGVGTIKQFIDGTQEAFGMAIDLGAFLSVYGSVFNGNLGSWSIGGEYPSLIGDLLIDPKGLSGSHNNYETDVSPTQGDLYQFGDADLLRLEQFKRLYELGQANGDSVDLEILKNYRSERWDASKNENPYFFHGPFTGIAVSTAAFTFIYRFMGNKSQENPTGLLDGETLKHFFSVEGEYPNFSYSPGHERFPDNWYKRHPSDEYSIPYFLLDLVDEALDYPKFLSVGGNTGEPNSFVGVDLSDLTGGVFNSENLLEGNNAICFALQASLQLAPDILRTILLDITGALGVLGDAVNDALSGLSCPALDTLDITAFDKFPGFSNPERSRI